MSLNEERVEMMKNRGLLEGRDDLSIPLDEDTVLYLTHLFSSDHRHVPIQIDPPKVLGA